MGSHCASPPSRQEAKRQSIFSWLAQIKASESKFGSLEAEYPPRKTRPQSHKRKASPREPLALHPDLNRRLCPHTSKRARSHYQETEMDGSARENAPSGSARRSPRLQAVRASKTPAPTNELYKPGDPRFTSFEPPIVSNDIETRPKESKDRARAGKQRVEESVYRGRRESDSLTLHDEGGSDTITVHSLPASLADAQSSIKTRSTSPDRILPRDLAYFTPSINFSTLESPEHPTEVTEFAERFQSAFFHEGIIPQSLQV